MLKSLPLLALRAFVPSWLIVATLAAGCGSRASADANNAAAAAPAVAVKTAMAVEQPITRFLRASGTLTAQDEAEVAAEIAGRVVATPVERGTGVRRGSELIRISAAEVDAQAREADANVAQIVARLGQSSAGEGEAGELDVDRVPEVAAARATFELAQADFERVKTLFEKKLVSQSEFDLRRAQVETSRRQYESARNGAQQQNQALAAARARAAIARKAVADTVVRAPFDGVVGERLVSVGDYVTRGTKVASVMRVDSLRVELTVPAQHMAEVAVGRSVTFVIDAYPDRTFTGHVRYVSPDVRADSRSLVVEAVVPNADGMLKPGLFATAQIEEASKRPGILVPVVAVRNIGGTARVFVVNGDQTEERIVTTAQTVGHLVEITSGINPGDVVATTNVVQLVDGARVAASE
jgi:membrane fusion protein (multidrug efflux system)